MKPVSSISSEKATSKRRKIHRPHPIISGKIIAFDVLSKLQRTSRSGREISSILEVPNSTIRSWQAQKESLELSPELNKVFASPHGTQLLQRMIMAAALVMEYGPSGIRGIQEYLRLSGLDQFVASSNGALHDYSKRIEQHIIAFGADEEKRLAKQMRARKITAGLDEMFRGRRPSLVAIEVVSNFILLEKFTEDRKAETWKQELNPRLCNLGVEVGQVVSDLCGALTSYADEIGAQHSPDLFHGQHELAKAAAAPLSLQERAFEKEVDKAEARMKRAIKKRGEASEEAQEAIGKHRLRTYGLEERKKRRERVRTAKKALGEIYHPVDVQNGRIQTTEEVKKRVCEQLQTVTQAAKEAGLSQSCMNRIAKAGRAFDAMIAFLTTYLVMLRLYVDGLQLTEAQKTFFLNVVFPLAYFRVILKRQNKEGREKLAALIDGLEVKIREGPWSREMKEDWLKKAKERAELFQRSTSCVEGRNGMLSLLHHRCHRLSSSRLKALTVVHNYHIKRTDGSTAAERLFEQEHRNLFVSLVENVRIPGKPQFRSKVAELAQPEAAVV